jgi:hypothetical protein
MAQPAQFNKEELEELIEEKIFELVQEPDSDLELRKDFLEKIEKRKQENANIPHSEILNDHG